jgi:MFS family permease
MVEITVAAGTLSNNTNPVWYKDVGIRKTVLFSCICFVAQMTAGFDEVTAGSFQAIVPWQTAMGNPSPSRLGLITSILYAGGVVGALIGAPISDCWGRRMVMATGAATCLTGSILQSASVNVGMFVVSRALIGMGVSQSLIGGPSLVAELAHPRIRGTILSFVSINKIEHRNHLLTEPSV